MKSIKIIAGMIALSILVFSCEKDKDDNSRNDNNNEDDNSSLRISSITEYYEEDDYIITDLGYDDDGRLVEQTRTFSDSDEEIFYELTYSNSTVTVNDYLNGELYGTETYTLNDQGQLVSAQGEFDYGSSTETWMIYNIEYDVDGFITTMTEKDIYRSNDDEDDISIDNYTYTIEDGNVIEVLESEQETKSVMKLHAEKRANSKIFPGLLGSSGSLMTALKSTSSSYITEYKFYTLKANTLGIENQGISFFGRQNKNLIKSASDYMVGDSENSKTENFTYEYDEEGRAVKQISDDDDEYYISYTYID